MRLNASCKDFLPAHALAQSSDVRGVMATVPGIDGNVHVQSDDAALGMDKLPAQVGIRQRFQQ